MTESAGNESGSALLVRIQQLVSERGVDIRQSLNGNALRLEFADGQRILINFDAQTNTLWLAARSGGIEFNLHNGTWRAHDQSELFAKLRQLIEQTITGNPLNSRAPDTRQSVRPAPVTYYDAKESRQSHGMRNVLFVLLAAVLGFWAAQRLSRPQSSTDTNATTPIQAEPLANTSASLPCEHAFPANGSVTVFPESGLRGSSPDDTEITLKNDHAHPLLLIFSAPDTVIPAKSVLIHAHQSATVALPAGQYDMMFGVGNAWCNPRHGFSDGQIIKINKPLNVQMGKPMQLAIQTSGAGMEDFQLIFKTASPEEPLPLPTFTGDGSMEVQRQSNGHFYLPGTIEGVPVTFIVDTGASVTSISSDLARQARIRNCKEVQFHTANGTATGCVALVPQMTLGNFDLHNITVAVMPNLDENLLGANVLRNFHVSQSDSTMLIGRK